MTFDESNARLTQALAGRTIDHIIRNGKELEIVCTCGHVITIQSDINHDIQFKKQSVKIVLPPATMIGSAGRV